MEVKVTEQAVKFKPLTVTLTLTDFKQVGALFAVFNHSDVTDILSKHGIDDAAIREAMMEASSDEIDYHIPHSELSLKFSARN